MIKIKEQPKIKGVLKIRGYRNGVLISEQNETNLVVSSSGYGRNLIVRQLTGNTDYGIEINQGKIGDDGTAPSESDTDLGNVILDGILIEKSIFLNDEATFSFFITDSSLADGTYKEFGMFIGGQLFSRAIFSEDYIKSTNQSTRIDYSISLN